MKYFYINNIKFKESSSSNKSIIDFCENIGINIPHFCYHKNLSIAGNCRMCLVELKNSPKPLISCAMSLSNNMEIYTHSVLVQKARENVMEFLLLNHPLDCPVCDQGGECDLQDQSFLFGTYKTRFYNYKRVVTNKNLGVIVKTVMTRCIHCTRCVRFSDEISSHNELGVYGRGNNSEIGTYVDKIFNSELSGNVIDICPVGALTSKPHPFVSRSWELKTIQSLDYLDSFGHSLQIFIKDNSIIKILPDFNLNVVKHCNNWITDKTRFSFTGMFSPERISETFIFSEKLLIKKSWKFLFKDIIYNIYFQEHLVNHFNISFKIVVVLNEDLSLDILQLFMLLKKKYSFFSLKTLNNAKINNDVDSNFFFNSFSTIDKKNTNFCFLFNLNPRFESYLINLKLKKLYLSGNFTILFFGSLIDLTYPVKFIGTNIENLKNLSEGNHPYCQLLKQSVNPFLLTGANSFLRNDSKSLFYILKNLENYYKLNNININSFNYVSNTLSDSTLNYINKFDNFSFNDFKNSTILYFINLNYKSFILNKIVELKLIKNYNKVIINKLLINQHNLFTTQSLNYIKKAFNLNLFLNLPNKVFFETSEMFINNEGILKKKIKVLNNLNNSKSNWKIIRSLYFSLYKIKFFNQTTNSFLSYNTNRHQLFLKFFNFLYIASSTNYLKQKKMTNNVNNCSKFFLTNKFHFNKLKIVKSKSFLWLDDFYIGGKDIYSKFSLVLIKCSKELRKNSLNFQYIL